MHLTWKTIQKGFSCILYTSRHVKDHEDHVRWVYLTIVLTMGKSRKHTINIQGGPKKTIPKLTKMIDTNDIFGTNYDA